MQRKKSLLVTLDTREPSTIDLTVAERVQLDRIVHTAHGRIAERHGALLCPGTTRISLAEGQFCFQMLSNAQLHVVQGGVTASMKSNTKDPGSPPLAPDEVNQTADRKGDDADGEQPTLTVT